MFLNPAILTTIANQQCSAQVPTGSNVRQSEEFQALKVEIQKLESIADFNAVNWSYIAEQAKNILETQGNDILVAAYLIVAWINLYQFKGFIEAINFFSQLVKRFGNKLQPENKLKAQQAALDWLSAKVVPLFLDFKLTALDLKNLTEVSKTLGELDDRLNELFGRTWFTLLLKEIKSKIAIFTPPEIAQDPNLDNTQKSKVEPTLDVQAEREAKANLDKPRSKDLPLTFDMLAELMQQFSRTKIELSVTDPTIYYLNRTAAWADLQKLPSHDNAYHTHMKAPLDEEREQLIMLKNESDIATALKKMELLFIRNPFWLDLQRVILEIISDKVEFAQVANIISYHLLNLIKNFPLLRKLIFIDDTHLCDSQTQAWLVQLAQENATLPNSSNTISLNSEELAFRSIIETTTANMKPETQEDIIISLQNKIKNASSARLQVIGYISLCEVLVRFNVWDVLPVYLEQLQADFEKFHLADWDPMLATEVLSIIYRGNKKLRESANKTQMQFALGKLMLLDHAVFKQLSSNSD